MIFRYNMFVITDDEEFGHANTISVVAFIPSVEPSLFHSYIIYIKVTYVYRSANNINHSAKYTFSKEKGKKI